MPAEWTPGPTELAVLMKKLTTATIVALLCLSSFSQVTMAQHSHGVLSPSVTSPQDDAVLREASRRLRANVRPYDSVGRFGGEEFMVILPETEVSGATYLAEEIRLAVASSPFMYQEQSYELTVSVGVSSLKPIHGEEFQRLVSEADRALYRSKKQGRNCVTAF